MKRRVTNPRLIEFLRKTRLMCHNNLLTLKSIQITVVTTILSTVKTPINRCHLLKPTLKIMATNTCLKIIRMTTALKIVTKTAQIMKMPRALKIVTKTAQIMKMPTALALITPVILPL